MNVARFSSDPSKDNTDRIRNNDYLTPAFASTVALLLNKSYTLVKPATLTGVVTFSVNTGSATTPPFIGDRVRFLLTPDGTTRVVTFGTGFLPTGTLAVTTAKQATIEFMFNGTGWIETGRAVSA